MGNEQGFMQSCKNAFEAASKMQNPLIVHHYDCDGITSGSIVASWFEKNKMPFRTRVARKLDEKTIDSLKGEQRIIFVDLGSGSQLVKDLKSEVVVIDHHQPQHNAHIQANPHLFGFDGGSEISASGCAYFVFQMCADLGVVGAVGDMQYPLKSLNKIMLSQAVEKKQISVSTDLVLFGRGSRPLMQLLMFADDPYIPGITGNESACKKLLSDCNIDQKQGEKWRTYNGLSKQEKTSMVSALADHMSLRVSPKAANKLTGEVYTLLNRPQGTELSDASEFSTLLNACGRNNQAELGVKVCMSKPGAFDEAKVLLAAHRKNLREGISFAAKNVQDLGKFLLIDGRGAIADSIIGIVAGMLYAGTKNKPVLALSLEPSGKIKLSARGTRDLVNKGLNLGKILSQAGASVNGVGGGHNIAAGATIPNERLDDFLREFAGRL